MLDENTRQKVIDALPHGSGFNYLYQFHETRKYYCFSSYYDYMDGNGFYDDAFSFTVKFQKTNLKLYAFKLFFHNAWKKIAYNGYREYFEQTIFNSLYDAMR